MATVADELRKAILDGWDPDDINERCLESQRHRRFVQRATGGEPFWAYMAREGDDRRFIRKRRRHPDQGQGALPLRRTRAVRALIRRGGPAI